MRSMTGFGVGEAMLEALEAGPPYGGVGSSETRLFVEIRAVNHRYLDVRVRSTGAAADLAPLVEQLAREKLTRGRFDVSVRLEGSGVGAPRLDRARARSLFEALTSLRDELAPGQEVPFAAIAAMPELWGPPANSIESTREALTLAFERAVTALDGMRGREGRALAEDLIRRLDAVRALTASIGQRVPRVVEAHHKRLRERAERLRAATDIEVEPGRLEQEVALFADRVDIAEELTRLGGHAAHFEALLAARDAVGRRLEFLLQEMAREANTLGSKSQDLAIAHAVVDLKAEIDRMREQAQNIE